MPTRKVKRRPFLSARKPPVHYPVVICKGKMAKVSFNNLLPNPALQMLATLWSANL
jgi:hypothetical protein